MMNCLEWLPIYFGILRTGAWVVPLNFRFNSEDIEYCTMLAEAKALFFGEAFIDRIDTIKSVLDTTVQTYIFVGPEEDRPKYAEDYSNFLFSGDTTYPGLRSASMIVQGSILLPVRRDVPRVSI